MKSFLKKKNTAKVFFTVVILFPIPTSKKMKCHLKQNKKDVVSPHPYQHVVLSVFWILSILTDVGSSVLICSFPVTHAGCLFLFICYQCLGLFWTRCRLYG